MFLNTKLEDKNFEVILRAYISIFFCRGTYCLCDIILIYDVRYEISELCHILDALHFQITNTMLCNNVKDCWCVFLHLKLLGSRLRICTILIDQHEASPRGYLTGSFNPFLIVTNYLYIIITQLAFI